MTRLLTVVSVVGWFVLSQVGAAYPEPYRPTDDRQVLQRLSFKASDPGARILDGKFTAIQQAIGTPKARTAAAEYLREFVADIKSSGLVARLIERHGVKGVNVPP